VRKPEENLYFALVVLFLLASPIPFSAQQAVPTASAGLQGNNILGPVIGIWNSALSSGNITSLALQPGSEFQVSVNLTGAPEFDFYSFSLEFNPFVIQLVNTTLQATVFWQRANSSSVTVPHPQYLPDTVLVRVQGSGATTGSGMLLFAWFRVLQLSLSNLLIRDSVLSLKGAPVAH